jgi:hypothetical protein
MPAPSEATTRHASPSRHRFCVDTGIECADGVWRPTATLQEDPTAHVTVQSHAGFEVLNLKAAGLAPQSAYDFFVTQIPSTPFGLSWYEARFTTDKRGKGHLKVVGRFDVETFVVGAGVAAAPVIHSGAFPDAATNPAVAPLHLYHLGVWFDSSTAASAAGCPGTLTPFNGTHTARIQVLNTSNYAADQGPLRQLAP